MDLVRKASTHLASDACLCLMLPFICSEIQPHQQYLHFGLCSLLTIFLSLVYQEWVVTVWKSRNNAPHT